MIKKRNMNFPRVLVGAPVYSGKDYMIDYWIKNVKNLTYPNHKIIVVDNSKKSSCFFNIFKKHKIEVLSSRHFSNPLKRLKIARQKLYDYAIENDYDYLLSLEQDIISSENIIEKLIRHKKLIVGAPYPISTFTNFQRRRIDYVISASKINKKIGKIAGIDINEWYISSELKNKKLLKVKSCSFGCTLISVSVLKKIKARNNQKIHRADDSYFFQDCYNKKISVYLDCSLLWKIDHIKNLVGELLIGGALNDKHK